jgi:hypothetical protein
LNPEKIGSRATADIGKGLIAVRDNLFVPRPNHGVTGVNQAL